LRIRNRTPRAAFGGLAAAAEGCGVVEGHAALDLDAEGLGFACEDVGQLGVTQQGLGGDTADVEADAAPVLLLDNRGLQAELAGADRGGIAAWPRTQHDDIVCSGHLKIL
jgi:hypothetical protein